MVPVNYTFREATIDDLSKIFKWTEELMDHETLDKQIELPLADDIHDLLQEWLKNLISDNNSLIIIATNELLPAPADVGFIVGFLQFQPNNFTKFNMHAVIQMVWVDPEQRKKGLALQLVKHMEDSFKNLKIPYCEVQYSDTNNEAEAFWGRAGYNIISHSCRKML